jgi:hypothetical protein
MGNKYRDGGKEQYWRDVLRQHVMSRLTTRAFSTTKAPMREHVIEANEFRLKDAHGRTRAILGMSQPDGRGESGPRLTMFDADGVDLLTISLAGGTPQILLSDGGEHVEITVNEQGRIAFFDQDNKPLLVVRARG